MNRLPVFAGSFYPDNPEKLQASIRAFLADAQASAKVPKAIIVPHAGYIYSGAVAASAYVTLKNSPGPINRVVLIGPSHRVGFAGLALSGVDAFTTPLGNVAVDQVTHSDLLELPFVTTFEQAHNQEHCLEVQLPFLQTILPDFNLTPIVVGNARVDEVGLALERVWGGDETLLVISSDLSHYHDYATANRLDLSTCRIIEALDYAKLTSDAACGAMPIAGLLYILKKKSMKIKTLDLRNSGDTAGDKRRVVGYAAYAAFA
jgi:MEMO1 family protein